MGWICVFQTSSNDGGRVVLVHEVEDKTMVLCTNAMHGCAGLLSLIQLQLMRIPYHTYDLRDTSTIANHGHEW